MCEIEKENIRKLLTNCAILWAATRVKRM